MIRSQGVLFIIVIVYKNNGDKEIETKTKQKFKGGGRGGEAVAGGKRSESSYGKCLLQCGAQLALLMTVKHPYLW